MYVKENCSLNLSLYFFLYLGNAQTKKIQVKLPGLITHHLQDGSTEVKGLLYGLAFLPESRY